jgi:hypothetical protein
MDASDAEDSDTGGSDSDGMDGPANEALLNGISPQDSTAPDSSPSKRVFPHLNMHLHRRWRRVFLRDQQPTQRNPLTTRWNRWRGHGNESTAFSPQGASIGLSTVTVTPGSGPASSSSVPPSLSEDALFVQRRHHSLDGVFPCVLEGVLDWQPRLVVLSG